jgi:hypothetical protein
MKKPIPELDKERYIDRIYSIHGTAVNFHTALVGAGVPVTINAIYRQMFGATKRGKSRWWPRYLEVLECKTRPGLITKQ